MTRYHWTNTSWRGSRGRNIWLPYVSFISPSNEQSLLSEHSCIQRRWKPNVIFHVRLSEFLLCSRSDIMPSWSPHFPASASYHMTRGTRDAEETFVRVSPDFISSASSHPTDFILFIPQLRSQTFEFLNCVSLLTSSTCLPAARSRNGRYSCYL